MKYVYRAILPSGFETVCTAASRAEKLSAILALGNKAERQLCRRLLVCRPATPCQSGACPKCTRQFRLWLLKHGLQIVEAGGPPAVSSRATHTPYWTAASIIPRGLTAPVGQLGSIKLASKVKSVAKTLSRSQLSNGLAIGGVDVSLNSTDNLNPFWQVHLYLLISGKADKGFRKKVRAAFPPEPTAARPCRCTLVYSPRGALTYAYKAIFSRRCSYHWQEKKYTRHLPLTPDHQRELALFLDQGNAGSRLILYGLRRNGKKLERSK